VDIDGLDGGDAQQKLDRIVTVVSTII